MATSVICDKTADEIVKLAASLYTGWESSVLAAHEQAFGSYIPSRKQLVDAINAVFWASLSEEEGRPALTRIRLVDVRDPGCRLSPRELSPLELCKLSPVADDPDNFLLVNREGRIVGIGRSDFPGSVSVTSHARGTLAVLQSNRTLAVLEAGEWHVINNDANGVAQLLRKALPESDFPLGIAHAFFVVELALAARRARRGAAFVLIPPGCHDGLEVPIRYQVESFPAAADAFAQWEEARKQPIILSDGHAAEGSGSRALLNFALRILSAAAGIDGATVLEVPAFRLVGFGAKIAGSPQPDDVKIGLIELPDLQMRVVQRKDLGGMRHQSAATLVQRNHSANVVIVSQDGVISLFSWVVSDQSVVAIRHIDRLLPEATR